MGKEREAWARRLLDAGDICWKLESSGEVALFKTQTMGVIGPSRETSWMYDYDTPVYQVWDGDKIIFASTSYYTAYGKYLNTAEGREKC